MAVQRIRVTFGRQGAVKFISHLDLTRMWQRIFRRADIHLAYSEGATPRPRFSLAVPLAVGVTSQAELMDVFLRRRLSPFFFLKKITQQLPEGITVSEANDVPFDWPSLQSQVEKAEYLVTIRGEMSPDEIDSRAQDFLQHDTFPWEHRRDKQVRRYDLRELVHDIWLDSQSEDEVVLGLLLKAHPSGSGRPEQVLAALGLPTPRSVHRTRLLLARLKPARPRRPKVLSRR